MMWVRLDCTVATHRKLLRAGAEAAWLWVCGLAYANQHTTNGAIPFEALTALYPSDEWTPAKWRRLASKLVTVGLWEVEDSTESWSIHGYEEHQSEAMSDAVEARREREREKKRAQREREKQSVSRNVSRGDKTGDAPGNTGDTSPTLSPRVSPPSVPSDPSVPSSEDNSPSGSAEGATAPDPPPPVVPPSGDRQTTDAAKAPDTTTKGDDAKPAKRKRAKAAPTPDTIPAPGTLARRVFEAIVGDRALCAITANPGDASERWADPATYPGVDVLAEVRRAGEFAASHPGRYNDGRAFLRGWLQRKADEIARAPKTAQHDPSVNGQTYVAPPPPARAFVPKVVPLPPGFDAALLGGTK